MEGANIIVDLLTKNQEPMISIPKSKQYNIELEPLHSALKWDALGLTSLKSLTKFLPPRSTWKDRVVQAMDALKYILYEVVQGTLILVLKRLAVLFISPRIVWKLVRDVPASVTRLAAKGVPCLKYIFKAAKATFLGYAIGALASWLLEVGLLIFVSEKNEPVKDQTWGRRVWILGKKLLGFTATCIISFTFGCICASIGAFIFGWIGTLIAPLALPSLLTWILAHLFCHGMGLCIGFAVGDFAGRALISFCLEKLGF